VIFLLQTPAFVIILQSKNNIESKNHQILTFFRKLFLIAAMRSRYFFRFAKLQHECSNKRILIAAAVNFINVIRVCFLYECRFGSFFYVHVLSKTCQNVRSYEKIARLMLMKLTPEMSLLPYFEKGLSNLTHTRTHSRVC